MGNTESKLKQKLITKIALTRLKTILVKPAPVSNTTNTLFLGHLAELGYTISNPTLLNNSIFKNFDLIIDTLIEMKGGDVEYVPLFDGFPNKVPNKSEFFETRVLAFLGNVIGLFDETSPNVTVTKDGIVVPNWMFDITEFGADPIIGRQTEELFKLGKLKQSTRKSEGVVNKFIGLTLSTDIDQDLKYWVKRILYSKSSIKEHLKEDLNFLISEYGIDYINPEKVVFKEIRSYVMSHLWHVKDFSLLKKYINTPTDILRMFAAATDSDISLSTNIKFPKLNRSQRKFILECLDGMYDVLDDLNAYKGLWLSIAKSIHPGEFKKTYPLAFTYFDVLRNHKILTFNGQLQKSIKEGDLDNVLTLLSKRPGIFGRHIHDLLTLFDDNSKIISEFKKVSNKLELKNLLVLEKYFETINSLDRRAVINKKGKIVVLDNTKKEKLSSDLLGNITATIKESISKKCEDTPLVFDEEDSKVWVDPELRNYTVPLNLRSQSDGLLNIARGSRIKFNSSKTLRLFSYWKESNLRTDFDTSLISFDEDMNYRGHVSYTNLSEDSIVHSGDITSAPFGAAEFIDVDLNNIDSSEIRYLAIQIYVYAGESFNEVEKSYAGWSFRDQVSNDYKTFDIKSVDCKVNVRGNGRYAIPVIVDLKSSEIIYVDLYVNGVSQGNNVEGSITNISDIAKEVVKMIDTKPNMLDLINYRLAFSNAEVVENKDDATVTFGISECTHSIDNIEYILSELL